MQRGPQRRTGALDRAQRLRGRGQQVAESGWQGRRYASREAAGEAQFQVGGADSRAGGSGAGLRARIAGLVEGQVRCKPIGAAARVRAGGGISISTTVPWGVRCAVLQRPRTATVRHGYSTSARGSGSDSSLREQRQGRRHLTTMERGRNGTVQLRQKGGVGTRGLVDSDGALFLKATSTMEGARWVGLTSTRTAPRPPRA